MFPGQARRVWSSAALLSLLLSTAAPADTAKPAGDAIATCGPVAGVLLERATPDAAWKFVNEKDSIPAEALLVALPDAQLDSANGQVRLKMIADVGQRGPLPVFESAVRIHANPKVDLDVSLDRGILGFINRKKAGAASVLVRFAGQTWHLTLREPDTRVGLEIYGRQPPGPPQFVQVGDKLKFTQAPTIDVYLLVTKGQVGLQAEGKQITLEAPPGSAKLHWDSVAQKIEVSHLPDLPPSLLPKTPKEQELYQDICTTVKRFREGSLDTALEKALQSEESLTRRSAVVALAALDKLPGVINVLATSKYADARDLSIVVLRNWIGRGPGQVEKLYDYLLTGRKLTPVQAKTAIHFLLGFDEEEQRKADIYEVLIDSLKHSKLAVRELAHWHLVRLVPEGKKIDYDAGAPVEARERAYEQWRALVPPGQLPPHLRTTPASKK